MRVKKDERQIRTEEWMTRLEQYARAGKLPLRILDELEECRNLVKSDWATASRTIEELLESIEGKLMPVESHKDDATEVVSVEEVKMQVRKMAQRCHTENLTSIEDMAERKNTVIRKMYGQISEISHTKAHLEELKNEELYLRFFRKCSATFENDALEMVRELLQSISNNYSYMLDHMKSMFQSIGGYKRGIGNEKIYLEYEARRGGINQKILGEAQTADMGEDDIISFGERTKDIVRKIVRKLVRRRRILAWVPLFVLLCLFTVTAVVRQEQSRQTVESVEQEDDSALKDMVVDYGKKAVKSASAGVLQAVFSLVLALFISLGAMVIFVVLVIILLYLCYLKLLKIRCNHQICKKCGEYLQTELSQFQQSNSFFLKLDTVMKNAAEEYERQYMEVLNSLFADTEYADKPAQQAETAEWDILRKEWEQLKYR